MKKIKILIIGYYGFDNFGDEALLYSTKNLITNTFFNTHFKAYFMVLDNKKHKGFKSIPRFLPFKIIKSILSSDIIIFGGGGIFQNKTSNLSLMYYLSIIWLSKLLNKHIVLLGQGMNDIHGFIFKLITKLSLYNIPITLRDKKSFEFIKSNKKILSSDLLFNYPVNIQKNDNENNTIYINLRYKPGNNEFVTISNLLFILMGKFKNIISVGLSPDDLNITNNFLSSININPYKSILLKKDPNEFNAIYQKNSIFLSQRLHGIILATLFNIPFITITNSEKLTQYTKEAGMLKINIELKLDTEKVNSFLNENNYKKIKEFNIKQKKQSLKNIDFLKNELSLWLKKDSKK